MDSRTDQARRVLVFAPIGRDAELTRELLARHAIAGRRGADLSALVAALDDDVGCVVLVDEALVEEELPLLRKALERQPPWRDLPLVVVARDPALVGEAVMQAFPRSASVTLLERPLSGVTLVSAVQACLRATRRHFEIGALIAEREQTLAQLRESEERFRLMADGLPLIVWVHDAQGAQEFVNQTFCEFFGVTRERMRGGAWQMLVHPEDVEAYTSEFLACMREQRFFHAECRVRDAQGRWRWIESWARPRRSQSGELLGFVGTSADVTARRAAEAALREADRAKDEFLAMLAHELRNPLAPIRTGLDLMKHPGADESMRAQARDVMERQVAHMVRLIDDLLDVSRIARGRLELRRSRIDLREAVRQALETSRPLIDASGHALAVDLPEDPVWIDADLTRIAQALANLVNNAARYTPAGGRIAVALASEGNEARVEVADTGVGIVPEAMPRLFEMFSRGEQTPGGLEIGLTLARRLAEMHGGTIEAASEGRGKGSRFTLRLPLAASLRADAQSAQPAPPAASGKRVLIVDDNRDAALSLASLLRVSGNDTHVAHDGETAVKAAREYRPDAVLLDLGMPGMDGYEICRALRGRPGGELVRIIALTGWGQDADRKKSEEAGFDAHLVKPATLEDVQRALSERERV